MKNISDLEIDTSKAEKRVIENFNKSYNEQQKRIDALDAFINAIGKNNIARVWIKNRPYVFDKFGKLTEDF